MRLDLTRGWWPSLKFPTGLTGWAPLLLIIVSDAGVSLFKCIKHWKFLRKMNPHQDADIRTAAAPAAHGHCCVCSIQRLQDLWWIRVLHFKRKEPRWNLWGWLSLRLKSFFEDHLPAILFWMITFTVCTSCAAFCNIWYQIHGDYSQVELRQRSTPYLYHHGSTEGVCWRGDCGYQTRQSVETVSYGSYGLNWRQYEVTTNRKLTSNLPFDMRWDMAQTIVFHYILWDILIFVNYNIMVMDL